MLQIKLEWLYQLLRVRKIDDGHELASENKFWVLEKLKWVLENVFSAWECPVATRPYSYLPRRCRIGHMKCVVIHRILSYGAPAMDRFTDTIQYVVAKQKLIVCFLLQFSQKIILCFYFAYKFSYINCTFMVKKRQFIFYFLLDKISVVSQSFSVKPLTACSRT